MPPVHQIAILLALIAGPILASPGARAATGSGSRLFDVSQEFMDAYNRDDAGKIMELMAPPLRAKYPAARVRSMLGFCKSAKIPQILRTSLPVSGTRYFGFFAVYGTDSTVTMLMEVDPDDRIVFVAIAEDVGTGDFSCSFNSFKD